MTSFRRLRADEIDARVATINEKGLSLLLYKDARCDMRILDETVGPMNWQRTHSRENANCTVSIWDAEKQQWIGKEDTGTESNTEKEKGLASDSFKRACFNWGIGRELYSAPFIWVPAGNYIADQDAKGKWKTFDRFRVTSIGYDDAGNICQLTIQNAKTKKNAFEFGAQKARAAALPEKAGNSTPEAENSAEGGQTLPDWAVKIEAKDWTILKEVCKKAGVDVMDLLNRFGYEKASEVSVRDFYEMIKRIEEGKI